MALAAIVLVLFVVAVSGWLLLNRKKHAIDLLPGPPTLPIFGNALMFLGPRDYSLNKLFETSKTYWPLFRLWLGNIPIISPLDPKDVEVVLTSSQHITKSHDYKFIGEWLGEGLLTSRGSKWHKRRKMLTPAFHFSILEQFVPVFSEKTHILLGILREHEGKPEGVDIAPLVTRCALDIICETAMGTSVRAQEDSESKYVTELYELNDLLVLRMIRPWLHPDWIFRMVPMGFRTRKLIKSLHAFTNKVIHDRREELEKKSSKTAEKEKCVEELREIFDGSDRDPTFADLGSMKYLERVIKETLRLKPSVHLIARKLDQTLKLDGKEFPAGTVVHVNIYSIHRNPQIFTDPEKFDPDRFSPENARGRHPYVYVPFSAGPRNCIGQKFAMLEMKNLLSTVLRHFRLESLNPTHHYIHMPDLILRPKFGLQTRIHPRGDLP
ncbi:hypothetical protein B566_EDAN015085 [Ephemera danica]|nr:hypothetical protein B566_EDAN015085 [Ephemera danica]